MQSATDFLQKNQLLNKEELILVAVSGGQDSMALAHLLHKSGYKIAIAHLNYQLRGADSELDMRCVENFAKSQNIEFYHRTLSKPIGANTQIWARNVRYEFFNDLCATHGFSKIATAHHADDSLETMLINLSRGTGINGLSGIPSKRDKIVRPFLETTRAEIEDYVQLNGIVYREDMSNNENEYLRNLFRNELLPTMKKHDVTIMKKLAASNQNLKNDAQALNSICETFLNRDAGNTWIDLNEMPSSFRHTIVYHTLREYGFNRNQSANISMAQSGSSVSSGTYIATKKGTIVSILPQEYREQSIEIPTDGLYRSDFELLAVSQHQYLQEKLPKKLTHVWMDSSAVSFPLYWHTVSKGTRFSPLGADYSVDVFDYLKNAGYDKTARERMMVITDNTQKIIWIPGVQLANDARCKSTTRRVISINYSIQQPNSPS